MRYYIQIKGNFDLTVVFIEVGIPTTLREIGWPKASFAKASFSQFWSTIPSHACQLLEIRTWVHETWGNERNERNVQWTLHIPASRGCSCQEGVYLPEGVCTCLGAVPARRGVYLPGVGCTCQEGVYLPGGVPVRGCIPACNGVDTPLNRMTERQV